MEVLKQVPLKYLFFEFQVILVMVVFLHVLINAIIQRKRVRSGISV